MRCGQFRVMRAFVALAPQSVVCTGVGRKELSGALV